MLFRIHFVFHGLKQLNIDSSMGIGRLLSACQTTLHYLLRIIQEMQLLSIKW